MLLCRLPLPPCVLPNLRAPRTRSRCPRVDTQIQAPESCGEGIRSMCLTHIKCLPASLPLDAACFGASRRSQAGGERAARLKNCFCYSPSLLLEEFQRGCKNQWCCFSFRAPLSGREDGDVGAQTPRSSARLSHGSALHPARPVMSCITCSVVGASRLARLYSISVR